MALFSSLDFHNVHFACDSSLDSLLGARRVHALEVDRPPCKLYQRGSCPRGADCPYRHTRAASDTSLVVCKHWLRGLCKKSETCEFLHEYDLSKMPTCHFFSTFGVCSNLDCPFLHVKSVDSEKECPYYQRGFCRHGPNCMYKHTRKLCCPDYLSGFCLKGPSCTLAHPKFELQKESEGKKGDELMLQQPDMRGPIGGFGIKKGPTNINSIVCRRCGEAGHFAGACPKAPEGESGGGVRSLKTVTCFKCGTQGHYANVCPNTRKVAAAGGFQSALAPQRHHL